MTAAAPTSPTPPPRRLFGALCALTGAALWGGTAPFAKRVLDTGVDPLTAAGLLYVGGALGPLVVLALAKLVGPRTNNPTPSSPHAARRDVLWILAAALVGGALAPVFMMYGQKHTSGLATALLIAVEPPATALIAVAFGERLTRRLVVGGLAVLAGAILVGLRPGDGGSATTLGALAVILACVLWSLDSNLTARVAHRNPLHVAAAKGAIGGPSVLLVALLLGTPHSHWTTTHVLHMLAIGFTGYGVGLAMVIRAFRELGAARTGALFATTSIFAALSAMLVLHERPTLFFAAAALLITLGVALIVTDPHTHHTGPAHS